MKAQFVLLGIGLEELCFSLDYPPHDPVDTGRKLNVHKTFRRRPGHLLNVLSTFNLRPVSTGEIILFIIFPITFRFISTSHVNLSKNSRQIWSWYVCYSARSFLLSCNMFWSQSTHQGRALITEHFIARRLLSIIVFLTMRLLLKNKSNSWLCVLRY